MTDAIYNLFELCMTIPEFVKAVKPALFPPHPFVNLLGKNSRPSTNCSLNQHIPSWNRFLGINSRRQLLLKYVIRGTTDERERVILSLSSGSHTDEDIVFFYNNVYNLHVMPNRGQHYVEIVKMVKASLVWHDCPDVTATNGPDFYRKANDEYDEYDEYDYDEYNEYDIMMRCVRGDQMELIESLRWNWNSNSYELLEKYGNYFKYIEATI
jgi:hypothetical protein